MMDNTIFYVDRGRAEEVRDHLAEASGVDPSTVLLAPAMGYEWEEPDRYTGKTLLQFRRYKSGDLRLELEILLGGARLGARPGEEPRFFRDLASRLHARIVFQGEDGTLYLTDDGTLPEPVDLEWPDEYGAIGPVMTGARPLAEG